MHEFGLCEGVLDTVRARAGGRQVAAVRVRFGVRHAVDQESLAQAFSHDRGRNRGGRRRR